MNCKTYESTRDIWKINLFKKEAESMEETSVLTGFAKLEATMVRVISEKPARIRNMGEKRFRQLVLEILLKMGIKQQANGYPWMKNQGWASRLEVVYKRVTEC